MIVTASAGLGGEHFEIDIWFAAVDAALIIFCVTRLGLLATVVFYTANSAVAYAPFTTDLLFGTPPMRCRTMR